MKKEELKALLAARLLKIHGQCNSGYLNHAEGQIRALEYTITGEPPQSRPLENVPALLDRCGIPWPWLADGHPEFGWPRKWLKEHGFTKTDTDKPEHPIYSKEW